MAAREQGLEAHAAAGHSLGEYPALWAAGVLSTETCFHLVKQRGRLMDEAAAANPGGMAAVIGLEREELEGLVHDVAAPGRVISLANHNSRQQIVVTGHKDAVQKFCMLVKEKGKRAVPLKVSGAYHSPLMEGAAEAFAGVLEDAEFHRAAIPVYSNVTAEPEIDPAKFKMLMSQQICSPVRWFEIVNNMHRDGVRVFIESGPKKVLTNLCRNCLDLDEAKFFKVEAPEDIQKLKEII
jgi:[acyl-carrier-protein] S-malonyltransferase